MNSYSLCPSVPEQFALLARTEQSPTIVTARLYDYHRQVLAFSPCIRGMPKGQLEICAIPSVTPLKVKSLAEYIGIQEYEVFRDW